MNKLSIEDLEGIFNEFSSIEEIASGGFKTVYDVCGPNGREALKVVSIPDGSGARDKQKYREECIGRIQREVDTLKKCQCPFMVNTGTIGLQNHVVGGLNYAIYSEEFLNGSDLWRLLRSPGHQPPESEVKQLMKCLVLCIQELWSLRTVHRDIKPLNVLRIDGDVDRPFVLIDLGIAFALEETALTHMGSQREPMATYRYIAPEQCVPQRRSSLDYRCDLYSAALTVFEYSTGVHPVAGEGDDMLRTIQRALHNPAEKLKNLRSDFSDSFCDMIDGLLNKRPHLRPANFIDLVRQLEVS